MRTFRSVRSDLERLDRALETMPEASGSPSADLMRDGLAEMRDEVAGQVEELRRSRLEVVLQGLPVIGHEVRVDALVKLLDGLQESITAVAQALTGRPTSRSSVPAPVREATGLRLASVYPGSFGAVLKGPDESDDGPEQPLFDLTGESPTLLDEAVDRVLTIIDLAADGETGDAHIVEAVLPLGTRTYKHLSDLSAVIAAEEINASLSWSAPSRHGRRDARLTRRSAQRLNDVLARNRLTETDGTLVGRLGTVSDIRNRVELEIDTGEIIPATVVEELLGRLGSMFAHRVLAQVEISISRSLLDGSERRSYTVTGLERAPEPAQLPNADPDE